ncbi:MAG: type IX secretion system membrane protein PorP/SprF [Bacteroidetes bacterium]|nr:MAG: type IX secretion system membrane protein PorP/SprF [Bacteroidota bacterium]
MKFLRLLIVAFPFFVQAQTRPIMNQYMLHQSYFNPGYFDTESKFAVSTIYRRQWMRQNKFPEIGVLYGHYNFDPTHSVGAVISNDLMNGVNHFEAAANYVYNIPLSNSYNIGLGIRAGISEQNLLSQNLLYFDPVEPTLSEDSYTFIYASAGIGASLSSKTLDIHLSAPYLFGNRFLNKSAIYSPEYMPIYFSSGYKFRFSDWFILYPNMFVSAVKGSRIHGKFNVSMLSSQLIWFGLGASTDASIHAVVGIFSMGGLRVTYSYENSFFTQHYNTGESHEISLSYAKVMRYNAFNRRKSKVRNLRPRNWKK